jgi:hypothetical protein
VETRTRPSRDGYLWQKVSREQEYQKNLQHLTLCAVQVTSWLVAEEAYQDALNEHKTGGQGRSRMRAGVVGKRFSCSPECVDNPPTQKRTNVEHDLDGVIRQ